MRSRRLIVFSIRWWSLFLLWSVVYLILSIPAFVVTNPLVDPSRRRFHAMNRFWGSVVVRVAFGRHFRAHGLENLPPQGGAWVVVSNHQSLVDILVLLTVPRDLRFVIKRAIFFVPFLGFYTWGAGYLSLRRGDAASGDRLRTRCAEALRRNIWIHVFPEGTRSEDGRVGRFRKGAFDIARANGAGIVPMSVQGSGDFLPKGRFFGASWPQPIDFRVFPPISAEEVAATDSAALAGRLRKQLDETVAADARVQEQEKASALVPRSAPLGEERL